MSRSYSKFCFSLPLFYAKPNLLAHHYGKDAVYCLLGASFLAPLLVWASLTALSVAYSRSSAIHLLSRSRGHQNLHILARGSLPMHNNHSSQSTQLSTSTLLYRTNNGSLHSDHSSSSRSNTTASLDPLSTGHTTAMNIIPKAKDPLYHRMRLWLYTRISGHHLRHPRMLSIQLPRLRRMDEW